MTMPSPLSDLPNGAITALDLFRELVTISARLATLEAQGTSQSTDVQDHETRIRVLERFRSAMVGAATLTGAAAGFITSYLPHLHG